MKFVLVLLCVAVARAGLAPLITSDQRSVPDSWIVKIKDSDQLDRVAADILSRFSNMDLATPSLTKIRNVLPVLTLKIPARLINEIRSIDGIEYIEQDSITTLAGNQYNPSWGIDRVDSRTGTDYYYTYNDNVQGKGVNIYVVDTGVQTSHTSFGGRASLLFGATDNNGHGTHCAGTAAGNTFGLARQANIFSVKVCDPSCYLSTILNGFDAVKNHGGSAGGVLSISLSGFSSSPSINTAVKDLWNNGYLVSHAAGNDNADACNRDPQNINELIVVGATDSSDKRAYFSNYGSCVDIFAPGVSILSAKYSTSSNSGSSYKSGTSMACPHVTGAAALEFGQNSNATPSSVKNALINNATPGVVSDPNGTPNRLLYVKY
ncbi:aqualysin-1-like [Patiria miniata]|uniref:Peptidase S8/S53 domain-containing protein n=1 Tax=Patiria miniata TaxID=46514 RepID=A0A914A890_PATMI|nr:aqualysin-1-like [Patiria miniata]